MPAARKNTRRPSISVRYLAPIPCERATLETHEFRVDGRAGLSAKKNMDITRNIYAPLTGRDHRFGGRGKDAHIGNA